LEAIEEVARGVEGVGSACSMGKIEVEKVKRIHDDQLNDLHQKSSSQRFKGQTLVGLRLLPHLPFRLD
jgi:hypothetical protein